MSMERLLQDKTDSLPSAFDIPFPTTHLLCPFSPLSPLPKHPYIRGVDLRVPAVLRIVRHLSRLVLTETQLGRVDADLRTTHRTQESYIQSDMRERQNMNKGGSNKTHF
jgi:hypothetical protein